MKKLIALTLAVAFTASHIHAEVVAPETEVEQQEERIEGKLELLKAKLKELATKKFWKDLWGEQIWTKKHWKRNTAIAVGTVYASMLGNAYANSKVRDKHLSLFGKLSRHGTPNWGPFKRIPHLRGNQRRSPVVLTPQENLDSLVDQYLEVAKQKRLTKSFKRAQAGRAQAGRAQAGRAQAGRAKAITNLLTTYSYLKETLTKSSDFPSGLNQAIANAE